MSHKLAEETLSAILALVLDVPDEEFSSTEYISPFAQRAYSTSETLLVCKLWLRVATPLLYHTVVLRSKAQTQALAKALKKAPEFGRFLRKLRVEGGFGAPLGLIMSNAATSITDMSICVDLQHKDNAMPMAKAMKGLINLRRLAVYGERRWNVQTESVWGGICFCLQNSVSRLDISIYLLSELVIPNPSVLSEVYVYHVMSTSSDTPFHRLKSVAEIPSVRAIYVDCDTRVFPSHNSFTSEDFKHKVFFASSKELWPSATDDLSASMNSLAIDPNFEPLARVDEYMKQDIWKAILQHALGSTFEWGEDLDDFLLFQSLPMKALPTFKYQGVRNFSLVCKQWRKICRDLTVRHVRLGSDATARSFLEFLNLQPLQGYSVRTLVFDDMRLPNSESDAVEIILTRLFGLEFLVAPRLDGSLLTLLVLNSSQTLVTLVLRDIEFPDSLLRPGPYPLNIIFPQLQRLEISFRWEQKRPNLIFNLDKLLELSIIQLDDALLGILSESSMPSLEYLTVQIARPVDGNGPTEFLAAHGSKCRSVHIYDNSEAFVNLLTTHCPNIRAFSCCIIPGMPVCLNFQQAMRNLVHLTLKCELDNPHSRANAVLWSTVFESITSENFPALQTITLGRFAWPSIPRDIEKSVPIIWAETLIKHGIKVMDEHGQAWRPRLRTR